MHATGDAGGTLKHRHLAFPAKVPHPLSEAFYLPDRTRSPTRSTLLAQQRSMAEKRRTSNLALSGDGGLFKTDAYLYDDFGSEILAYLQYAIDERLPSKIVPMALISHLKKNCQWKISKARVEAKLKYFWQRTKPAGAKDSNFDLIYQRSYKALPQLPKEFAIQVRKRADDLSIFLNKTDRRWRLRSASCTVSPIRKHATASLSKMSRSGPRASRAHCSRSQTDAVPANNGVFLVSSRCLHHMVPFLI
jgi:hypothetical protein